MVRVGHDGAARVGSAFDLRFKHAGLSLKQAPISKS